MRRWRPNKTRVANHAIPNGTPTLAATAARFGDRFVGDWFAKFRVQFPSGTKFRGGVEEVVVNVEIEEKVEEVDVNAEGEEEVEEARDIISPGGMVMVCPVQL